MAIINTSTITSYAAFALAGIAAVSVGQRLVLWQEGTAQYTAAGAAPWVYPAITVLQAFACAGLLFQQTRALAAAGIAIVPTALVLRRTMASQAVWTDAFVLGVAALGLAVLIASLAQRKRQ